MKYRSKEEIVTSILRCAEGNGGISKTKMMFNSLPSYQQLLYYSKYLLDKQLLTYDESNNVYNITSKGLRFLELSNKMMNLLKKTPVISPTIKWV